MGHVQRKIANTVATHATLSPWPALMEGIVQLSSSATTKHHALCLFLLDKLAENIGSILVSNLDTIMRIILPFLLENNELNNRILAAQALCSVLFEVQTLTPNLCDSLKYLPPIILHAVAEHEDLLLQDMLQNMSRLSTERPELFINSWDILFQAIQILCENQDIEGGSKVCALQIMITLITAKKSSFCSVESSRRECLRLCIRLMTAVDEDDDTVSSHSRPESEGTVLYCTTALYCTVFSCDYYFLLSPQRIQHSAPYTAVTYNICSPSFYRAESGFGDVDGDGGDGNISDFAASCLDTLSAAFEPLEILQICMSAAWTLVSEVCVWGMGYTVCAGIGYRVWCL